MNNGHIIIILILQIIAIIVYNVLYILQFNFSDFIYDLKDKAHDYNHYEIISPFIELFHDYYDSTSLDHGLKSLLSISVAIITIIELIIITNCQFEKNICYKKYLSFFLLLYCVVNMIIYLVYSFIAKYKVNLKEDEIYVFDEKFNKEIKKHLNLMIFRKIFLIICSFIVLAGIAMQFVKIINENKNDNNNGREKIENLNSEDILENNN